MPFCQKCDTYPHYILHETELEHPVELDLVVVEDVLETALATVLGDEAHHFRLDAGSVEPDQVVVMEVLHLPRRGNRSDQSGRSTNPPLTPAYLRL